MPFLELFDETLDINSTENYELSIQVSPEILSFCLLDTIRNKYVLLRSFEADESDYYNSSKIDEIISKDDFLGKRYKRTSLIIPSRKFTLMPAALYDPGKKDEYYSFNHRLEEEEIILSNKTTDPDVYILFSALKPVNEFLTGRFPGVLPLHHIKPLLNHISHCRKNASGSYIHLHIEREFFNLIIFNNDILAFCNSFIYRNINDILYYVLNTFRNLEIKQEETINLSGLTEKYDDLSSVFSIYVRSLNFSEPKGNFTFSYVFNDVMLHRFLNLFIATNCES